MLLRLLALVLRIFSVRYRFFIFTARTTFGSPAMFFGRMFATLGCFPMECDSDVRRMLFPIGGMRLSCGHDLSPLNG